MANKKISAMAAATTLAGLVLSGVQAGDNVKVPAALTSMLPIGVQFFTASDTYTPTPGTKAVLILGQGSGGGGGGCGATSGAMRGGNGGPGECRMGAFAIAAASYAVTLPAGGAGGAAGANSGVAAADASVAGLMTCKGGGAGAGINTASQGANGDPGAGGSGGVNINAFSASSYTYNGGTLATGLFIPIEPPFMPAYPLLLSLAHSGEPVLTRGAGGRPATKPSGTATSAGGDGGKGYFLIIEFGAA